MRLRSTALGIWGNGRALIERRNHPVTATRARAGDPCAIHRNLATLGCKPGHAFIDGTGLAAGWAFGCPVTFAQHVARVALVEPPAGDTGCAGGGEVTVQRLPFASKIDSLHAG